MRSPHLRNEGEQVTDEGQGAADVWALGNEGAATPGPLRPTRPEMHNEGAKGTYAQSTKAWELKTILTKQVRFLQPSCARGRRT